MKEVKKPVAAKAAETKAAVPAEAKTEVKAEVKAAPAKKTPVKAAAPAPAKKAPVKKAPAKKAPAKTAAAKKAPAKTAAPMTEVKEQFYIQFLGKDLEKDEIISRAKAAYKEAGNKAAVKSLDVYVKFEESAVYYVVNGDISGRFEI